MPMDKIKEKLIWIDNRVQKYLLHLMKIVKVAAKPEQIAQAEFLLINSLRAAFFYDFNAETEDKDYLIEAEKYKKIVYDNVDEKTRGELKKIEEEILQLFPYEKEIWKKVKSGEKISDDEIREFWRRKSSDSLFYSRIINIFSAGKDVASPIYTYTQILDMLLDVREYEQDFQKNNPNMIYMKLSQVININKIPNQKTEAISISKEMGIKTWIENQIQKDILPKISKYDFKKYEFLKNMIEKRYNDINAELS